MGVAFNVNGAGFKGGRVGATEAGLIGFYDQGKPWTPDRAAVRALLPYRWRHAFDSAGPFWWNDDLRPQARLSVTDSRGRHLTTVYANPIRES